MGALWGTQAPKHPTLLQMRSQAPPTQALGVMLPVDPFHGASVQEKCLGPPNPACTLELVTSWLAQPSLRAPLDLAPVALRAASLTASIIPFLQTLCTSFLHPQCSWSYAQAF